MRGNERLLSQPFLVSVRTIAPRCYNLGRELEAEKKKPLSWKIQAYRNPPARSGHVFSEAKMGIRGISSLQNCRSHVLNKEGHFEVVCLAKERSQSRWSHAFEMHALNPSRQEKFKFVRVEVNGIPFEFKVELGAEVIVLPRKCLGVPSPLKKSRRRISLVQASIL
ncbi:hypothetical protein HPB48_023555 [Haemaphysalis longicornis]|uniref:Uncharacterized protein n=1 Tax=Haemaphysalis longicornis TaxID=44386 RepID=A0A9J6H784_HAELO|nr:hypothetical protein HPB48_023555 [Haemaphysalis longicornis]